MAVSRDTPVGLKLEDGYSTKIAFAADSDVSLWEKTVTPPGVAGGDKIPIHTMHNSTYRDYALRSLKELTDSSFTAAYDTSVYDQIIALINVETEITVHFSDGATLTFYGGLTSFVPTACEEGAQPEAECTISCTNRNPNTGAESAPVLVAGGTP